MMIEFKNKQTEQAFKAACQPTQEQLKLKRGLFLLKNALYWEGI
jgi:hypothetical protein